MRISGYTNNPLLFFPWNGYAQKHGQGSGPSGDATGLPLFSPQLAWPCLCSTWTQNTQTAELWMMNVKGAASLPWATKAHCQLYWIFQWSYVETANWGLMWVKSHHWISSDPCCSCHFKPCSLHSKECANCSQTYLYFVNHTVEALSLVQAWLQPNALFLLHEHHSVDSAIHSFCIFSCCKGTKL